MEKESVTIRFNLALFIAGVIGFSFLFIGSLLAVWFFAPGVILASILWGVCSLFPATLLVLLIIVYVYNNVTISKESIYINSFFKKKRVTILKKDVTDISVLYIPVQSGKYGPSTNTKVILSWKEDNDTKTFDINPANIKKLYDTLVSYGYKVNGYGNTTNTIEIPLKTNDRSKFVEFDFDDDKKIKIRMPQFIPTIILILGIVIMSLSILIALNYEKINNNPKFIILIVTLPVLCILGIIFGFFQYVSVCHNKIILNSIFQKTIIQRHEIQKITVINRENSKKLLAILIYKSFNQNQNNQPSISLYANRYDLKKVYNELLKYHYIDIDD